jgi:ABC-2 type transport system permease protein
MGRVQTLIKKEFLDLARNRAALVPVVLVTAMSLVLPFGVAIAVPAMSGRGLGNDADLVHISSAVARNELSNDASVQLFLFQQFLMLFLLTPITGAMALASHAIVGEKQARTLEPLLATSITTFELLAAKVLGALLPSIALTLVCFGLYVGLAAAVARPGVFWILLAPRSLAVAFLLGPLAALAALQLAVCVSSRTNDARSAQQIGALVILPLGGVLVAQLTGTFALTVPVTLSIAAALLLFDALLMWIGIVLFDRESILTRWK